MMGKLISQINNQNVQLIETKSGLVNLAEHGGNQSQACKAMG